MDINIGDIVGRRSYGCDVLFRVHDILKQPNGKTLVILKGVNLRIVADADLGDIMKVTATKVTEDNDFFANKMSRILARAAKDINKGVSKLSKMGLYRGADTTFKRPGKVLHLDGDKNYLEMCVKSYREFEIEVIGRAVPESEQPKAVRALLEEFKPDILVLTGHDGLYKKEDGFSDKKGLGSLDNYRSSRYFVDAVKEARRFEPSLDELVIFAGACQSCYEAIMAAGANFASAPERILIHALDPVMVCQKIAYTAIDKISDPEDVLNNTMSGIKGIGGIQTRGKYRSGMPRPLYTLT